MGVDIALVSTTEGALDDLQCKVCHQLVDMAACYTRCTHGACVRPFAPFVVPMEGFAF